MRLTFSAIARADLIEIGDYIARDNHARALTFVEEIERKCRTLPNLPLAHPLLPRHEAKGIRRAVHGAYLVFYRADPQAVTVLRVLHGARDYEALLFPRR